MMKVNMNQKTIRAVSYIVRTGGFTGTFLDYNTHPVKEQINKARLAPEAK